MQTKLRPFLSITLMLTLPLAGATAQSWTTNDLPPGLIAWWQAEGNMLDSAGPHHGGGDIAPTYLPGRYGQAFQFNGTDQSVQIPDGYTDLDAWTQFTLEAWVNLDRTDDAPGPGRCIISKVGNHRGPYSGNFGYQFGFANGCTKLFCQFNTDARLWPGYSTVADLPGPVSTNVWFHVAATYDHNAVKLYLNGQPLVTNIIGPVTIANTIATLRISKDDNDNVAFAGRIDDTRIYNRALTAAEIAYLHQGPPPPVSFTTGTFAVGDENSGPDCLATADVNGDGRLDLISANYGFRWANPGEPGGWNNTLTVLTNNGSGGFGSNTTLIVGFGPSAVVAADVNGDGKPDLISANETDNSVTVLTNNGSGLFGGSGTFAVGVRPRGLVAADVNGDLALDVVCPNAGANTLTVLTNQGRGVFGLPATLPVGNEPLCVAAADFNGDGQPDLISANKNDDSLTVLTNNGGSFGFSATLPVGHFPNAVSAADFNGDAKLDLVSVNWGAATMTVLTNNGSGSFGFNATLGVGNYPSTVAVADFNGDGMADLICASTEAHSLRVLTNNGSGGFGYDTTIPVGRIPNVISADLNSDGKLDLACPNFRDGTMTVVLNTTTFTPAGSRPTLTIRRHGNAVRLSWPSATPGWSLQQKPAVSAAKWLPSGHEGWPIADEGINKSLTLPASHADRFFRLLHP